MYVDAGKSFDLACLTRMNDCRLLLSLTNTCVADVTVVSTTGVAPLLVFINCCARADDKSTK